MIDRSLNYGRHHVRNFLIRSQPFQSVLDLGAGNGSDLFLASEINPSASRIAIELYPPNIERLQGLVSRVIPIDIEYERLPFGPGEIDVVIANQVLEHTKEIFWIFHEVTRILPVKGKFIIGVPNLAALHNRLLLLTGHQPSPVKTASAHVRGFTKRDLMHFVDCCFPAGYRLAGFGGSNFYPFPASIAKPLASLFPGMAWGIFLLLEKTREYTDEFLRYPTVNQLETNFYLGN
jgi:SAM-dependent methyltransferase